MEIVATRNYGVSASLGPDDPIFNGIALTPAEAFATKENANAVVAWIQDLEPSECPPNVWNPWVTSVHHDGHGSFTIFFDNAGTERGFPVTRTGHMMFTPGHDDEITPTIAKTSTQEPPTTNPDGTYEVGHNRPACRHRPTG